MRRRVAVIILLGITTAVFAWFAPQAPDPVVAPTRVAIQQEPAEAWPALPAREQAKAPVANPFESRPWQAPASVSAVRTTPVPPPRPTAPPLPFTYLGRLQDGHDRVTLFLARGDKVYAVNLGDVIDQDYQVEAIANGQVTITYLPLKIRQSLVTGSDS